MQLNLWIRAFFFNIFNIQNLADFSKTLAKKLVEFTQEKQFSPKKAFPIVLSTNFFFKKKSPKKKIIDYFWGEYFRRGIFRKILVIIIF